jgi:hypothetical protein
LGSAMWGTRGVLSHTLGMSRGLATRNRRIPATRLRKRGGGVGVVISIGLYAM